MPKSRAFTLVELLTVLGAVAIVAAVLFPVFSTAKAAATRTSCISRFHQVGMSAIAYVGDYDDTVMPVNHVPGETPNSRTDRTWVQLLLPYINSFRVFSCPADYSVRPKSDATFDQDLIPGDLFARYYTASLRTNLGYNFEYLAPVVKQGGSWAATPHTLGSLINPSSMLLFVDSVWSVQNGVPVGGGSWLVSPPCRYEQVAGQKVDTFDTPGSVPQTKDFGSLSDVFTPMIGWNPMQERGGSFGGAWPWHSGRASVCTVEGSVRSVSVQELSKGCNVLPHWSGSIFDRKVYVWSPSP